MVTLFPMAFGSNVFVKEAKLFLDEIISMFSQASLQETEEENITWDVFHSSPHLCSLNWHRLLTSPETSHTFTHHRYLFNNACYKALRFIRLLCQSALYTTRQISTEVIDLFFKEELLYCVRYEDCL